MSKELRSALEKHEQKCPLEAQGPILSEKTTTLHIVLQAIAQLPFWQVLLRRNGRFHMQWHWQLASSERSSGKGGSDRDGKPGWGTGVQTEHSKQWGLSHGSQGGRATAKQLAGASEWARARPCWLVQSRCGFWVYLRTVRTRWRVLNMPALSELCGCAGRMRAGPSEHSEASEGATQWWGSRGAGPQE